MRLLSALILTVLVATLPRPASAQTPDAAEFNRRATLDSLRAPGAPGTLTTNGPLAPLSTLGTPSTVMRRDSVKNGIAIGAVIGGITLGAFGAYLCNALQEPGDPPCWRGVLTIGALGAGIGAAAGAGIDAAISRSTPMIRVSTRF